ncbi:MAG: porin family protein [Bacteroidales bacterium]|nr:porin family protein [Bacteroidales bacterium]
MKKFTILLFLIFTLSGIQAQNYQDVVYLKNGSKIHGIILEQIPGKTLKIETTDNNIFVFQMDEVEKISKERIVENDQPEEVTKKELVDKDKAIHNSEKRKGYLGPSYSKVIPLGFTKDQINSEGFAGGGKWSLSIGYLFSDHLGMAATIELSAYGEDNSLDAWGNFNFLVGPLLSFPIAKIAELDIRPMIGYSNSMYATIISSVGADANAFAYSIGSLVRFNLSKRIALFMSADYFSTSPEYGGEKVNIEMITMGLGLAYRLK